MQPRLLNLCRSLIASRSVTTEGTRAIAEFCAREILAPAGIAAQLVASRREGPSQVNLLAFVEGRERGLAPLVLNTHLDTVPAGEPSLWTECGGDPFSAMVAGERIYGLGAADTKLDFAAKATALLEVVRPRRDVFLVGTFGEEHGLTGAKELAESGAFPRGALAFVGEPSRLELVTAHKGLMAFELAIRFSPVGAQPALGMRRVVFNGKAAHSSTPALGDNAIVKALGAIASRRAPRIASLEGGDAVNKIPARCEVLVDVESADALGTGAAGADVVERSAYIPNEAVVSLRRFVEALKDFADRAGPEEPDFAAPTLTCNPGVVRTADGLLALEFELRPPPGLSLDAVRRGVFAIVEPLRQSASGFAIELSERRANSGFRSRAASETVELSLGAMARAGIELKTGVKSGCTEAGVYASAGLIPVVFGPGPSTGVIHAPNEYNFLAEVEAAIRFYHAILES